MELPMITATDLGYDPSEKLTKNFSEPVVAYTIKEGGVWHLFRPGDSLADANAVMFASGAQWDEVNGYRTNKKKPRLVLFTPIGQPVEDME